MSNYLGNPLVRKDINLYIVDRQRSRLKENVNKSDVLTLFIESISRSQATYEDYAKFLVDVIFSKNSMLASKVDNVNLTIEQKNYIKYLVSNKNTSCLFKQIITRGQIKLWYVLYILQHGSSPANWAALRDWIHLTSIQVTAPYSAQTEGYWKELENYEKYYKTIDELGDIVTMGTSGLFSKGYGNTMLRISEIRSIPRTPSDIESTPPLFNIELSPPSDNLDSRGTPIPATEFKIESYQNGTAPAQAVFALPPAIIPMAPIVSGRSILLKKKDYIVRNSASLYHENFLYKEKSWLAKNKDHKNFKLCSETISILRNVISSRISHLVMLKEFPYERILICEFITNFAIDTIVVLKDILKSQNINPHAYFKLKYPMNFEIASNLNIYDLPLSTFMVLDFLKEYLPLICSPELFQPTFDILKVCFHQGFLGIDINFEFTLLKFEMFNNKIDFFGPSKRDCQDIDNLLIAYARYVQCDKAFAGHAELHILRNLHKFREFNRTLSKQIHKNYNVKESHVGGEFIKADGNCLIAQFIYDYIKEEQKVTAHQEIVMKTYRA